MLKILLEKLILYFKSVPKEIDDSEKIVKIIFSPLNVNAKGSVKANAFRCKRDDLSVNRLDYTTLNYCKRQGIKLEKNSNLNDKNFYGIALLFALEIRKLAKLLYRPVRGNKAHAEIVVGFSRELSSGEVNEAQYNFITEELAKMARIYKDSDTKSKNWKSENSEEILSLNV